MKKALACLVVVGSVLLVIFVTYVNVDAIAGAFGNGPPYYGRTTNMDKWENPAPLLFLIDVCSALLIFLAGRWARKQLRRGSHAVEAHASEVQS